MADFMRPTQAFTCVDKDGVKRRFDPSMLVRVGHWAVKGRESLFAEARDDDELARDRITSVTARPVEQATAAPGEKRAARRPRKAAKVEAPEPVEPAGTDTDTDTEPAAASDTDSEV